MSLFQKNVLKDYLKKQDPKVVAAQYQSFKNYFHNAEVQQNIRSSKEEQFQATFLSKLFENILGYTLFPDPGYNLTTEFKNEKGAQKADGAILKNAVGELSPSGGGAAGGGGKAMAVIELKSTKTKDLESIRKQAFDYKANHSECRYVITSNFEKLRFYINDAVDWLEFDLFQLSQDDFATLYLCLQRDNLMGDLPQKVKNDSLLEEEKVTKKLYRDYSHFRMEVYRDLLKRNRRNPQLKELSEKSVKHTLFKKTQKLLDRFLFVFFAEDRGLIPRNMIKTINNEWKELQKMRGTQSLYQRYQLYFKDLNEGNRDQDIFAYNGGLFLPDPILDHIEIDDELLYKHTEKLTTYDFESEVDVNILGHIFEHSLNEIESVNAEIEGEDFDKQKARRKKDGVFYTPKYITKYIVDNTLGKLCEEKKEELGIAEEEYLKGRKNRPKKTLKALDEKLEEYRQWLLQLTICDPACGSGAFLNQALEFLIAEHRQIDEWRAKLLGASIAYSDIENSILENNLYGVDINQESVEIAKLSLWLRTAQRGRKLTSLSNNIKCGNSLIDSVKVAGDKAFKWEKEFPQVFKKGGPSSGSGQGFDVVIGNPPYGAGFSDEQKDFISKNFKSYQYKFESYLYFIERGLKILRPEGHLSFITPELFLRLDKSQNIRKLIKDYSEIREFKFVGEGTFEDVQVNCVITTLTKRQWQEKNAFLIVPDNGPSWLYQYKDWIEEPGLTIHYEISPIEAKIIKKIKEGSVKLADLGDSIQGLTPYDSYRGHSKELIKSRGFHFTSKVDETCGKWLDGKNVTRYQLTEGNEWLKYGHWLAAPRDPRFFSGPRLLFREVPGAGKRIQACYANETYYHGHSITPFKLKETSDYSLLEILGVVNSRLISFYARYQVSNFAKDTFPKLNPKDIKELPFPSRIEGDKVLAHTVQEITVNYDLINDLQANLLELLKGKYGLNAHSRKLQNWPSLDFKGFLKELQKAKVKLSLEEEAEWMEYFNKQKAKVEELQGEVERLDREIDEMVYKLYGLTDEEIGMVEGQEN